MSTIIKEGFLKKEGLTFQSWNNRWFTLTSDGQLSYSKDKKSRVIGTISVVGGHSYKADRKTAFGTPIKFILAIDSRESRSEEKKFNNRIYYVIGKNAEDISSWADAINAFSKSSSNVGRSVLVLGATGNVGTHVVRHLSKAGIPVRAVTRDPAKATSRSQLPGVEYIQLDATKQSSVESALKDVQKIFFATPLSPAMVEQDKKFLEFIRPFASKIKHIVRLSGLGAGEPNFILGDAHIQVEDLIKKSGIPYTIIRPNTFNQNIGNMFGHSIKSGGDIYSAFGNESMVGYIDTRDIGEAIAKVLSRSEEFAGKTLELSGPKAITHHEVASIISKNIGREVKYINIPDDSFRNTMKGFGLSDTMVDYLLSLFKQYQLQKSWGSHEVLEKILGRKAITFEQYVRDNITLFSNNSLVLVTGATGNVGAHVVDSLLKKGISVRATTRDINKPPAHWKAQGVDIVELDYSRPETIDKALQGAQKVFFCTPFGPNSAKEAELLLNALKKSASIKHVVRLSGLGADQPGYTLGEMHTNVEKNLKASGIPYTIVRPNSFAQNILNFFAQGIKSGSDIYSAFGDKSQIAYVDTRDVGAVAAEVLSRSDEFIGQTLDLSGPQNLTHHDVAAILSKNIGREVKYINIPDEAYRNAMKGYGFPDVMIDEMLNLYREYQAQRSTGTPDNIEKILGRKASSFESFIQDNVYAFKEKEDVILITGATGNTGTSVIESLLKKKGVSIRAATRDVAKASKRFGALGVDVVEFRYDRPETIKKALEGVTKVYFLSSFGHGAVEEGKILLEHIKNAGTVKFIVKLSVIGLEQPGFIEGAIHLKVEKLIRKSGIPFAFLRCNSFSQNMSNFFGSSIRAGGDIYSAFGERSKIAYIDVRDIGDTAAEVLTRQKEFEGQVIELHGPENITHHDVANVLSNIVGRKVNYVDITNDKYRAAMQGFGFPDAGIDILVNLYAEYQAQRATGESSAMEKVLGRKATTFEQFARDHTYLFIPGPTVVLVIGATGNIGKHVVRQLVVKPGVVVRAATRNVEKEAEYYQFIGAQPVEFNGSKPDTISKAFEGVHKVFFINSLFSDAAQDELILNEIRSSKTLQHVVYSGAHRMDAPELEIGKRHMSIVEQIKKTVVQLTLLRPSNFYSNINNNHGQAIKTGDGVIYGSYGEQKVNYVDPRDIAAVAVEALTRTSEFSGRDITISGPQDLDHHQIAEIITKVVDKQVKYVDLPPAAFKDAMMKYGMHESLLDQLIGLFDQYKNNFFAGIVDEVEQIIGRKKITFEEHVKENIFEFKDIPKLKVLVSGANGAFGSRTAKSLLFNYKNAVDVRVAVRSEEKGEFLKNLGCEVVVIDISKSDTLDKALVGVDRLFILPPFSEEMSSVSNSWTDAAKRAAKVPIVVKIGAIGSEHRASIMAEWHDDAEKYLTKSNVPFVIVRPSFAMNNFINQMQNIQVTGMLFQRFGTGKFSCMDVRDVGDVSAYLLASTDLITRKNQAFEVVGPSNISCGDMAFIFSKVLQRPVQYVDMSEDQAFSAMTEAGVPERMARGLVNLINLLRIGFGERTNTVVIDNLKRHGYSFEQCLRHTIAGNPKDQKVNDING